MEKLMNITKLEVNNQTLLHKVCRVAGNGSLFCVFKSSHIKSFD